MLTEGLLNVKKKPVQKKRDQPPCDGLQTILRHILRNRAMQAAVDKSRVIQLVYNAVDEVNLQLPKAQRLAKSPDVVISGSGSQLDSLGLVNLVFATEQQIEQEFNVTLTLAGADASNPETDPFRTLSTLSEHICLLLEKKKNG